MLHEQCAELALDFLTEAHVADYLSQRFTSPSPASAGEPVLSPSTTLRINSVEGGRGEGLSAAALHGWARAIHQRTDGNPLFMVNVVDALVARGVLGGDQVVETRHVASLPSLDEMVGDVPKSLRQMIEQRLTQVSLTERGVLEVASVAGVEFSAAAVAAGVETTVEAVEEQCGELARREQFLRARGISEWPDGTVATRYQFLHALYQEVLYERIPAGTTQPSASPDWRAGRAGVWQAGEGGCC